MQYLINLIVMYLTGIDGYNITRLADYGIYNRVYDQVKPVVCWVILAICIMIIVLCVRHVIKINKNIDSTEKNSEEKEEA